MPEAYHSKCNLINWENRLFINTNLLELYSGRLSLRTTPEPGGRPYEAFRGATWCQLRP